MRVRSAIVRPWIKAGLSALLLESEQRVAELRGGLADQTEEQPSPAAFAQAPSVAEAPRQTGNFSGPSRSARKAASSDVRQTQRPGTSAAGESSASSRQQSVRSAGGILATPGALPVEAWPERWLVLKNRRPLPPRPLVLWTYTGLGEDLTGTPDDVRRQVIVRMLMELRHPGGTHVFWPCGLAGEKPEDGPALFWSGVKLLNPRVLLLFGSDARDTLSMPRTLLPFCQERVYGRLVIQLPRPQSLAADEQSFQRALAFLSRLLSFCARRKS